MNHRLPPQTIGRLFLRFLRFGCLAWGGPVAQIGRIRQELVEEEKWITPERFNRVLAVYQALPGPEAHELCVYFGMIAGGRWGAVVAGLGFMLPGFLLMLLLSWLYVRFGLHVSVFSGLLLGCKAAVIALMVRALDKIGRHALLNKTLWIIALLVGLLLTLSQTLPFWLYLLLAGLSYTLLQGYRTNKPPLALILPLTLSQTVQQISWYSLGWYGLRTGLLTFGGAYTAIPFLLNDAVVRGGWMTQAQFLDGLALGAILPAPLIIFSTFVGYMGDGLWGAMAMTAGVFLPSFGFTLLGHHWLEKIIEQKETHAFLDGVTAGVVGLIAVTTLQLGRTTLVTWQALLIFALSLLISYRIKHKLNSLLIIGLASLLGVLLY